MRPISIEKNVGGIEGLSVVVPAVHADSRGYFMEAYNKRAFKEAGLSMQFVQDNQAISIQGVIRGLHVNKNHPQGKIIRVIKGTIFDVAVDLRNGSSTFGKWYGIELSSDNNKQLYIPSGFAHGYLVLSEYAEVLFKVTAYWIANDEIGIAWNSPELNINWPVIKGREYILNENDAKNKDFSLLNLS